MVRIMANTGSVWTPRTDLVNSGVRSFTCTDAILGGRQRDIDSKHT